MKRRANIQKIHWKSINFTVLVFWGIGRHDLHLNSSFCDLEVVSYVFWNFSLIWGMKSPCPFLSHRNWMLWSMNSLGKKILNFIFIMMEFVLFTYKKFLPRVKNVSSHYSNSIIPTHTSVIMYQYYGKLFFFLKRVYELSPFKKLNIFKEEEWFKEK